MGMQALKERDPRTLRLVLIGLVVVVLLCVVGLLVFNILTSEPDQVAGGDTPTPPTAPTEEVDTTPTPEEVTPTPTRVIGGTTPEVTEEPTEEPTKVPTIAPTVVLTLAADTSPEAGTTTITVVESGDTGNVVKNGDFEEGFDERGVGLHWDTFKSDNILAVYSAEAPGPYIHSDAQAQRITTAQASMGDRYVGIYQQINVVPNQTYTLTMYGQIRTGFGDVNQSSFGYRMQYAVAQRAMRNWEMVPDEDWVELPWDEQLLDSPDTEFLEYSTEIIPTSQQITLFIRTWNKWADPGEVHFTLDDISLTGPALITQVAADQTEALSSGTTATGEAAATTIDQETATQDEDAMVDKGLPVTGIGDGAGFMADSRFWGALVVLLLLGVGAVYRAKWVH